MSQVRGKNTSIELAFRKHLRANGAKGYRLRSRIPGTPDLYFPDAKLAVFIDGCFWHRCPACFKKPKSNLAYWNKKIADNVRRDRKMDQRLQRRGIHYLHIREHDIRKNIERAYRRFERKYGLLAVA